MAAAPADCICRRPAMNQTRKQALERLERQIAPIRRPVSAPVAAPKSGAKTDGN